MDISAIDDIYKSNNIYKALFICNQDKFNDYLKELKQNDYPISLLTELDELNSNSSRILFVSSLDVDYLELILHKINWQDFTIQINIDCNPRIDLLGDIETFFL